ncbi:MAG: helix-turn-helix domain-containing protein [Planctomycetota bacterium]
MIYEQRQPAAHDLAEAIDVVFYLDKYEPEHERERVVPNGRMTLVIELDGRLRHVYDNATGRPRATYQCAWLSGVHTNYFTIGDTRAGSRLMAVQFAFAGSMAITHRAASDFVDQVVPAADVFGNDIVELRDALAKTADPHGCLDTLESWLTQRFDASLAPPAYVREAAATIQRDAAEIALTSLSEAAGVSHRHFLEHFRRHVGITPKALHRILRFYAVFERIQQQEKVPWAALAAELGFADQAHFIREFRAFSGYRPSSFQRDGGGRDRTNFFPDDPSPPPSQDT